jgi:hypothetical protein
MLPHQQRVISESFDLSDRLTKLSTFIRTPPFHGLPYDEQLRLKRQELIMLLYEDVLCERIKAFPKEETK